MRTRRVQVHGHPIDIHIDVHKLAQRSDRLHTLREDLHRRTGDPKGVDEHLENHLAEAFGHFASHYYGQMSKSIDTIFDLREKIKPLYEGVISGKHDQATANQTMKFFDDLTQAMDTLHSPTTEAKNTKTIEPSLETNPKHSPTLESAMVAAKRQGILDASTDLEGFKRVKEKRAYDLQQRANEHRRNGKPEYADRIEAQLKGYKDAPVPNPQEFRNHLSNHPKLMEIAETGGLPMLQEQWISYKSRPRTTTFAEYVQILQTSQIRGTIGEFDAVSGFSHATNRDWDLYVDHPAVSNRFDALKGPDHHVTLPGTDAVLFDRMTKDIVIIDNKATGAGPTTSVTAMIENLPRNMIKDAIAFREKITSHADTPPEIIDAVNRYEKAAKKLEAESARWKKEGMTTEAVQKEMTAILNEHGIKRVVTTSHGAPTSASIKADLLKLGISTQDFDK
jgi:hypothetical protein